MYPATQGRSSTELHQMCRWHPPEFLPRFWDFRQPRTRVRTVTWLARMFQAIRTLSSSFRFSFQADRVTCPFGKCNQAHHNTFGPQPSGKSLLWVLWRYLQSAWLSAPSTWHAVLSQALSKILRESIVGCRYESGFLAINDERIWRAEGCVNSRYGVFTLSNGQNLGDKDHVMWVATYTLECHGYRWALLSRNAAERYNEILREVGWREYNKQ